MDEEGVLISVDRVHVIHDSVEIDFALGPRKVEPNTRIECFEFDLFCRLSASIRICESSTFSNRLNSMCKFCASKPIITHVWPKIWLSNLSQ